MDELITFIGVMFVLCVLGVMGYFVHEDGRQSGWRDGYCTAKGGVLSDNEGLCIKDNIVIKRW